MLNQALFEKIQGIKRSKFEKIQGFNWFVFEKIQGIHRAKLFGEVFDHDKKGFTSR